jgi:hypothetical protein
MHFCVREADARFSEVSQLQMLVYPKLLSDKGVEMRRLNLVFVG